MSDEHKPHDDEHGHAPATGPHDAPAADLGLEVHAGHGLDYETAADMLAIPEVRELNIGHFLIGEAVFVGLTTAIHRMRAAMDAAS